FQAEDGIRDFHVTGVQTCALPILTSLSLNANGTLGGTQFTIAWKPTVLSTAPERTAQWKRPYAPSTMPRMERTSSRYWTERRECGKKCSGIKKKEIV